MRSGFLSGSGLPCGVFLTLSVVACSDPLPNGSLDATTEIDSGSHDASISRSDASDASLVDSSQSDASDVSVTDDVQDATEASVVDAGASDASDAMPDSASTPLVVKAIAAQGAHACTVFDNGKVKCWGDNTTGQLGLGDKLYRGLSPATMGNALAFVDLGTGRTAISVNPGGASFTCALLDNGKVKCWGNNVSGVLGLGHVTELGGKPTDMGDALASVDLGTGRTATAIASGGSFTCVLLDNGRVKCWGQNYAGELGLGEQTNRGDGPGEMGDALPYVDLGTGRTATAIAAGGSRACAFLDNGKLKCWGSNASGALGIGDKHTRGDHAGEMGDALPYVELGTGRSAKALAMGLFYTCALLDNSKVKCWGSNASGQLGQGDTAARGDDPSEMGDALPYVDLGTGRTASAIYAGLEHTCAMLDNGSVKCWGHNGNGGLGLGDTTNRGDAPSEMGDALTAVNLGQGVTATQVAAGSGNSCALLTSGRVKCWGSSGQGRLGLGDNNDRGDKPGEMGDSLPYVDLGSK